MTDIVLSSEFNEHAAPKTLLIGEPGGGKTHALRTYCDAGIEVAALITEPMGVEVLLDTDPHLFHWMYIPIAQPGWATLISNAKKINMMSYEDLAGQKSGPNKSAYGQFIKVLEALSYF